MLYFIIWLFLLFNRISKKIIFIEVLGINELLLKFKGVKENRVGVTFWENRKELVSKHFCTYKRKEEFLRVRGGNQEQGRRAKGELDFCRV